MISLSPVPWQLGFGIKKVPLKMLAMNYKVLWYRINFYLTDPLHLYLEKSICLPELLYKGGGQLCVWTKKGKMGLKAYLTEWNQWTEDYDLHCTKYLVTCSIIKPCYCILCQFPGWPSAFVMLRKHLLSVSKTTVLNRILYLPSLLFKWTW